MLPRIKCNSCDMMFNNPSSLARHAYIHHDLPYPCRNCGKSFPFESALTNHHAVHRRHLSQKCNNCDKWFYTVGELNKHLNTHENHIYQYFECSYTTYDPRYLRAHQYTHSDKEKKFNCKYCGKAFKHHTQMLRHIRNNECPKGG